MWPNCVNHRLRIKSFYITLQSQLTRSVSATGKIQLSSHAVSTKKKPELLSRKRIKTGS